ncbi:glycosyl hydrolase 53 family protein [candidate division KSB1 bacterium]|nr:glycosyl hydrolase 53 family protein [candidate division KSB1 bacterium]
MRFEFIICAVLARLFSVAHAQTDSTGFIKGADVSFIPQIGDLGGVYKVNNIPQDPLKILKDHGFNVIRLKLWHTPAQSYDNLEKILYMAKRIKQRDLKFLLDFHYSDTWADPGRQRKPAAWVSAPFETLKDSVYQYTKNVMQALCAQQTLPEMVQLGNEITSGMLWNDGRVGGNFNTSQQWRNLGELLKAGIRGVRESCASGDSVRILIHLDRGGDNAACQWFFDNLISQNVAFDVIGLSYYPWWHGTLSAVQANLNDLALRYGKDLVIAETAYPWTLQWADNRGNIVGNANQLHNGYPATVEGQSAFLRELLKIVRNVRNQKGQGLIYWAPEYISVQPLGSPWENNTLFDFSGNVLSSMRVFLEEPPTLTPSNVTIRLNTSTLMDTLQPHHFTQIRGEVSGISSSTLPDGKTISWESNSELLLKNTGGDYWETTFQMFPGDVLSYKFWSGFNSTQGTFQRLGWEGPIRPAGGLTGNRRILIAGENDTVLVVQYYNSTGDSKEQYWQPFEVKQDSIAVYFRVNMAKAAASGRFNPEVNGPVSVRGDAVSSGGSLDWSVSKLHLQRENFSVSNGSFWSGTCYIPKSAVPAGAVLAYKFFIENDTQNGWENNIANRELPFSPTLSEVHGDTTIHWVYFDEADPATEVDDDSPAMPISFQLAQNHPNPFNPQTEISYTIKQTTFVNLKVYDVHGKLITALVQQSLPAGNYAVTWNAQQNVSTPLVSGLYFIRLETNHGMQTRKAILLK